MKKTALFVALIMLLCCACGLLAACGGEHYDLSYATWNLGNEADNNIERQMIKAFEEKYNVKVKIEEDISLTAYEDSIRAMAVKNKMPDVFMLSNLNFGLKERYVSDISDLVAADTSGDWNNIPTPIEEAVHFKDGIYAAPFAMHMAGYFVNVDLLEQYNLNGFLEEEITWESFYNVVKTMANYKSEGVIGLSHESTIIEWYPASVNENYGWFTWDGSEYHLDSNEFKDAIAKTADLRANKYTYDSLTEEDRAEYFEGVDGYTSLWDSGCLAIRWGYTYEIPDMLDKNGGDFEIKFIGVPGDRTPIIGDYLAISSVCENRELAYEFVKWMSFDPAGIRERISRDNDVTNTLPITVDSEIVNEYFEKFDTVEGLKEKYASLSEGIVESVKVVPGYTRSRWLALTGLSVTVQGETYGNVQIGQLLDWCWLGELQYADYAVDCDALADRQYGNAIKEYADFY